MNIFVIVNTRIDDYRYIFNVEETDSIPARYKPYCKFLSDEIFSSDLWSINCSCFDSLMVLVYTKNDVKFDKRVIVEASRISHIYVEKYYYAIGYHVI